jgi:hypothetical protein
VPVATEGQWTLYRINDPAPRAFLASGWRMDAPTDALSAVLDPSFPLAATALLEETPTVDGRPVPLNVEQNGGGGEPATGTAAYRDLSDQHAQVRVRTSSGGVVVVRNPWDENWHATLDGKPVPLLHADYVMQGVAVPAGDHTVDLSYRDPGIGLGLWISAIAWILLLAAYVVLRRRKRRELSRAAGSSTPRSAPHPGREALPAG